MSMEALLRRDCHALSNGEDKCYEMLYSDEEGRHMVAARDIREGETIMRELPCSLGPGHFTPPVCLGCYRRVDGKVRCKKCGWPVCSRSCKYVWSFITLREILQT